MNRKRGMTVLSIVIPFINPTHLRICASQFNIMAIFLPPHRLEHVTISEHCCCTNLIDSCVLILCEFSLPTAMAVSVSTLLDFSTALLPLLRAYSLLACITCCCFCWRCNKKTFTTMQLANISKTIWTRESKFRFEKK